MKTSLDQKNILVDKKKLSSNLSYSKNLINQSILEKLSIRRHRRSSLRRNATKKTPTSDQDLDFYYHPKSPKNIPRINNQETLITSSFSPETVFRDKVGPESFVITKYKRLSGNSLHLNQAHLFFKNLNMNSGSWKPDFSNTDLLSEDDVESEISPEYLLQLKLQLDLDNKNKSSKTRLRKKDLKSTSKISKKKTKNIFCQLCGDYAENNASIKCIECSELFHQDCVGVTKNMLGETGAFSCQTCVLQYPRRYRAPGTYLMDGKQISAKSSSKNRKPKNQTSKSNTGTKYVERKKSTPGTYVSDAIFEQEQEIYLSLQKNDDESDVDVDLCPICEQECTCNTPSLNPSNPSPISSIHNVVEDLGITFNGSNEYSVITQPKGNKLESLVADLGNLGVSEPNLDPHLVFEEKSEFSHFSDHDGDINPENTQKNIVSYISSNFADSNPTLNLVSQNHTNNTELMKNKSNKDTDFILDSHNSEYDSNKFTSFPSDIPPSELNSVEVLVYVNKKTPSPYINKTVTQSSDYTTTQNFVQDQHGLQSHNFVRKIDENLSISEKKSPKNLDDNENKNINLLQQLDTNIFIPKNTSAKPADISPLNFNTFDQPEDHFSDDEEISIDDSFEEITFSTKPINFYDADFRKSDLLPKKKKSKKPRGRPKKNASKKNVQGFLTVDKALHETKFCLNDNNVGEMKSSRTSIRYPRSKMSATTKNQNILKPNLPSVSEFGFKKESQITKVSLPLFQEDEDEIINVTDISTDSEYMGLEVSDLSQVRHKFKNDVDFDGNLSSLSSSFEDDPEIENEEEMYILGDQIYYSSSDESEADKKPIKSLKNNSLVGRRKRLSRRSQEKSPKTPFKTEKAGGPPNHLSDSDINENDPCNVIKSPLTTNDEVFFMAVQHHDFGYEISGYSSSDQEVSNSDSDSQVSENMNFVLDDNGDLELDSDNNHFQNRGFLKKSNKSETIRSKDTLSSSSPSEDEELTFRKPDPTDTFINFDGDGADSDREDALLQMHLEQLRAVREIKYKNDDFSNFDDSENSSNFHFQDSESSETNSTQNYSDTSLDDIFENDDGDLDFSKGENVIDKESDKTPQFTHSSPILNSKKIYYDTFIRSKPVFVYNSDPDFINSYSGSESNCDTDGSDSLNSDLYSVDSDELSSLKSMYKKGLGINANMAIWDDMSADDASLALGVAMSLESSAVSSKIFPTGDTQMRPLITPATNETGEKDDPIDGMVAVHLPKVTKLNSERLLLSSKFSKNAPDTSLTLISEKANFESGSNHPIPHDEPDFTNCDFFSNQFSSDNHKKIPEYIQDGFLPKWVSDIMDLSVKDSYNCVADAKYQDQYFDDGKDELLKSNNDKVNTYFETYEEFSVHEDITHSNDESDQITIEGDFQKGSIHFTQTPIERKANSKILEPFPRENGTNYNLNRIVIKDGETDDKSLNSGENLEINSGEKGFLEFNGTQSDKDPLIQKNDAKTISSLKNFYLVEPNIKPGNEENTSDLDTFTVSDDAKNKPHQFSKVSTVSTIKSLGNPSNVEFSPFAKTNPEKKGSFCDTNSTEAGIESFFDFEPQKPLDFEGSKSSDNTSKAESFSSMLEERQISGDMTQILSSSTSKSFFTKNDHDSDFGLRRFDKIPINVFRRSRYLASSNNISYGISNDNLEMKSFYSGDITKPSTLGNLSLTNEKSIESKLPLSINTFKDSRRLYGAQNLTPFPNETYRLGAINKKRKSRDDQNFNLNKPEILLKQPRNLGESKGLITKGVKKTSEIASEAFTRKRFKPFYANSGDSSSKSKNISRSEKLPVIKNRTIASNSQNLSIKKGFKFRKRDNNRLRMSNTQLLNDNQFENQKEVDFGFNVDNVLGLNFDETDFNYYSGSDSKVSENI
ncbi:hypothetical protein AYI68_g3777 [Smittium mucronatum]|uniref:PHD-type domain-containing protein n=1 Tax=Smittium mucronatum TaxID=133383 RepID=A0A1R0GYZ2_9FUNG|nr:hypothetical protein AYI68_g3777 [Smittium mucronatum]